MTARTTRIAESRAATATRARILEAGMACFARYGSDRTSLQDVADLAGVARNTVYRYFADRTELGAAVRDYERERMAAEFASQVNASTGLRSAIETLVRLLHDTSTRYHVREHLANLDLGQLRTWLLRRESDAQFIRDMLGDHVRRAAEAGRLANGLTATEALDWIVVSLSTPIFISGASVDTTSVDIEDSSAVAQFYADNLSRALLRRRR